MFLKAAVFLLTHIIFAFPAFAVTSLFIKTVVAFVITVVLIVFTVCIKGFGQWLRLISIT
jgi:hypothetical protein